MLLAPPAFVYDFMAFTSVLVVLFLGWALATRWRNVRDADDLQCATCAHWNQEEGQAIMRKFPAFAGAAEYVTPAEMAHGYVYDEEGVRTGLAAPKELHAMRWEDFGACHECMELRHRTDSCDLYQIRRKS
jgi:hypothetical protein